MAKNIMITERLFAFQKRTSICGVTAQLQCDDTRRRLFPYMGGTGESIFSYYRYEGWTAVLCFGVARDGLTHTLSYFSFTSAPSRRFLPSYNNRAIPDSKNNEMQFMTISKRKSKKSIKEEATKSKLNRIICEIIPLSNQCMAVRILSDHLYVYVFLMPYQYSIYTQGQFFVENCTVLRIDGYLTSRL